MSCAVLFLRTSQPVHHTVLCCFCTTGKAGGVGGGGGSITPDGIIPKLRALAKDKKIAGTAKTASLFFSLSLSDVGCQPKAKPCLFWHAAPTACIPESVQWPQTAAGSTWDLA